MPSIRIPRPWEIPERLATPEPVVMNRRQVVASMGLGVLGMALPWSTACAATAGGARRGAFEPLVGDRYTDRFPAQRDPAYGIGERTVTPEPDASKHNNHYEFTLDKSAVWELARDYPFRPEQWTIEVTGMVEKPRTVDLDWMFKTFPLEERLYRFRCVERWSMQVPWTGFPLRSLIDALEPLGTARYVRFVSAMDEENMVGVRKQSHYPWPYYEALRLDEARHDLAFVVLGIFGHALPMQHGAPWRIATPWKYGYKSPKSFVRIEFTDEQPATFWNDLQPREYGFYSNVDPNKPHPRWSQAEESDIGTGERRPTLLHNGYAEQVSDLYTGEEA